MVLFSSTNPPAIHTIQLKQNHQWSPNAISDGWFFYFFSHFTATWFCTMLSFTMIFKTTLSPGFLPDSDYCVSFTYCLLPFLFCICHSSGFHPWPSFLSDIQTQSWLQWLSNKPICLICTPNGYCLSSFPSNISKLKSIVKNKDNIPHHEKQALLSLANGVVISELS